MLAAGCATRPPAAVGTTPEQAVCLRALTALDAAVEAAGVRDARHHRVAGQPTWRSDRFLASFADEPRTPGRDRAWRDALARHGWQGMRMEWQALPAPARAGSALTLPDEPAADDAFAAFEARCAAPLRAHADAQPVDPKAVRVPDAYSDLQRALGLYPLARAVAGPRIRAQQRTLRARMAAPLPDGAPSTLYAPAPAPGAPPDLAVQPRDPLGLPLLDAASLQALIAFHAPRVQVLSPGADDAIGAPAWSGGQRVLRNDAPALYAETGAMRTRGGATLLQVAYTLWFPARTPTGPGDPYAGFLDGLVWRVTLAPDGTVLFHDSIHPCGCYHSLHLPAGAVLPVEPDADADEPLMVFRNALSPRAGRPVLVVAPGTHDLLQVRAAPLPGATMAATALRAADDLRALPDGEGGHRSWYDADGLIAASARPERFFLWPLGVPNAGAMRQAGHHAIAFVGRRHFDDAWLDDWLRSR